ncbi:uncharacterized protein [Nicotiana tomentosiformis]|uniref:uncharacterized protein n=1 Tax=Nicotiana tomentosiformis TaxID=4098 RepID=UPI00388C91CE
MAKTSQTIPQKEKASSSQCAADDTPIEPRPEECVPGACVLTYDFKVDKGSPVLGRCVPGFPGCPEQFPISRIGYELLSLPPHTPSAHGAISQRVGGRPKIMEKTLASVSKLVKENKRKRAIVPEDPKPKKRTARKPNNNVIPLTVELVLCLRDADEEEEKNDGSALAARMKRTTDAPSAAGSMTLHEAPPRTEDIPEKNSGGIPDLSKIEYSSHRSQRMGDMSERDPLRTEENAPSDSFGAAAIEDSPTFSVFSEGVIREAQALGDLDLDRPHDGKDPFRDLFTGVEDVAGTGDEPDLFHGAAKVHRETCSRSQNEMRRYEADLQRVIDERKSLTLLLGQREEEIKNLRDELAKAYRDQTDLSKQMIGKLREEVDVIKAESLQWKEGIDRFATEKETARAQLSSVETQLQRMNKKGLVQTRRIEEIEAQLASVLAKAKSDAEKAKANADALVTVYRSDAEAVQIHARVFDLAEEIKGAKELEIDAEALVSDGNDDDNDDDDDDDRSESGSENGGEPDREETAPEDDQEA